MNGFVELSRKLAQKWGSISCRVYGAKTMCICSCRYRRSWPCPTSCSASKAAHSDGSRWSSLSCASATGEDAFGTEVVSQPPLEMSMTISSRSIWNYIPLMMLLASAGSGSLGHPKPQNDCDKFFQPPYV